MSEPGDLDTLVASTQAGERHLERHERVVLSRGALVGRYVVTAELGAGAMGVVYAAYDPELDRKIALKLLDPQRSGTEASRGNQQRLLREAQALAKLSHPNVVTVHDVGVHDELVFIAMELVRGRTLRAWHKAESPRWPSVLDVLMAAGAGLAAAHEQRLVHRDFKPDNVMLGDDGRVRVMDFGLARSDASVATVTDAIEDGDGSPREPMLSLPLTHHGAILGTPAYMAPEQLGGAAVEAAADQFSFCASLWELLYGERPFRADTFAELSAKLLAGEIAEPSTSANVPRWLRRVVRRGLAVDPRDRWPSMQALLDAMRRARTRARWRKGLLVGGTTAAVVLGGVAWWRHEAQQRIAACEQQGASIRTLWNEQVRDDLRAAVLGSGLGFAETTADKVMPWVDAQADAWQDARTEVCLDTEGRGTWDRDTFDRALWCLDERRSQLANFVETLSHGQGSAVQAAVRNASHLTSVDACRDVALLSRLPIPPAAQRDEVNAVRTELSKLRALADADEPEEALELARAALARAEAIGWPPLTAAARGRVGDLLDTTSAYAEAEQQLERAYFEAAIAGATDVGASAAENLASVTGVRLARRADGLRWSRHAEVMLATLPDPGRIREAVHIARLGEIARVAGDYDEAERRSTRALQLREQAYGPDHPMIATSLGALARVHASAGEHAEARDLHQRALTIRENALGPNHPDVGACLNDMAGVAVAVGDYPEAKVHVLRALAIYEKGLSADHLIIGVTRINLANIESSMGAHQEAKARYEHGLIVLEKQLGPEHPNVAMALNNLALVEQKVGDLPRARALHERALAIREKALGPDHPDVARSLANLAEVVRAMKDDDLAKALDERAAAIQQAREPAPPVTAGASTP